METSNEQTAAGEKTVHWWFSLPQQYSDYYIQEPKVERVD
jgi:hypothetical protein